MVETAVTGEKGAADDNTFLGVGVHPASAEKSVEQNVTFDTV